MIDYSIFVDPENNSELSFTKDCFKSVSGNLYPIKNKIIPDFTFPKVLSNREKKSLDFYSGRGHQYDDTIHLTFFTHFLNENKCRNSFIDKLNIEADSKVLELTCGTGRDSVLISQRLGLCGELHMQDLSLDMMERCIDKLKHAPHKKTFCLSNASYLPYPDNYFDSVYSFGGVGDFSYKKKAFSEMARVTKVGGKVVVGDESIPIWLHDTDFYKILVTTNPAFDCMPPMEHLPLEARNVNITWVINNTFYLIDFVVGECEPSGNFDYEIPGVRGGTLRNRYENSKLS